MKKVHILLLTIVLTFSGFILGILTGVIVTLRNTDKNKVEEPKVKEVIITSNTVVEKLQQRSFLVTNSIITRQSSNIKVDYNSAWSNFWWGKEVKANANVQVDLGVDLTKITKEDIKVDHNAKTITVKLPQAEVYNTTVMGDIEVTSSYGLLKKLLANDPGGDYNSAKAKLTEDSKNSVQSNTDYIKSAEAGAADTIEIMLDQFGYKINIDTSE